MIRKQTATRGFGLLETFLARCRVSKADALIPEKARSGKLLDIGCGQFPLFLTKTHFREKYGVDRAFREDISEHCARCGIQLLEHSVEERNDLPFMENVFAIVTLLAICEHIEYSTMQKLMRDVHRILKPGGMCILTTPAHWTNGILRLLSCTGFVSAIEIDEHKELFDRKRLTSMLISAGFANANITLGSFECGMNLWACAKKN